MGIRFRIGRTDDGLFDGLQWELWICHAHRSVRHVAIRSRSSFSSGHRRYRSGRFLSDASDHDVSALRSPGSGSPYVSRSGWKTSSFMAGIRASFFPTSRVSPSGKPHRRISPPPALRRTTDQANPSFPKITLKPPHRVVGSAVGVGKEEPEIIEPVENGKLLPNDRHRVRVSPNPWPPRSRDLDGWSACVPYDLLYQGFQDVAVVGLIFRNDEHPHSAASSQPSANSSEGGHFSATSLKCGTSMSGRIPDSPVLSSRLHTKVVL